MSMERMTIIVAVIIVALVVVVVATVGAAIYFGLAISSTTEPEASAEYYPPNVLAYSWMTLNPGNGQRDHMLDMFRRFEEMSGFEDATDDAMDELESETGINFEDDVMTWIGFDMSAALMDFDIDDETVEFGATIAVRDGQAAGDFLDDWLDYMEESSDADFDRDSEGDFTIWEDESAYQVYALSDDLLVFATTRSALDDMLERVVGDSNRTLAADERFQQARAAMPDRRFASMYLDVEEVTDAVADSLGYFTGFSATDPLDVCPALSTGTPDWIAGSAGWVARGVVLDLISPSMGGGWQLDAPELADAATLLPDDTLGFFSVSFDPVLDHYRENLRGCTLLELMEGLSGGTDGIGEEMIDDLGLGLDADSTLADVLDAGLDMVEDQMGIDLESDLLDHLSGQFIVSVGDFDFQAVMDAPEENSVDAVVILSYRDGREEALGDSLDDLADELEWSLGVGLDRVDVGADRDARIFPIEGTGYAPGYALHDGYLMFVTTEEALKAVIARQNGEGDNLSSQAEYIRAIGLLPESGRAQAYVALNRIVDGIDWLEAGMTRDEYELLSALGAVAMSAGADGSFDRFTLALTLFPEE